MNDAQILKTETAFEENAQIFNIFRNHLKCNVKQKKESGNSLNGR